MRMRYETEFPCSARNNFEYIFGSGDVYHSKHQTEFCVVEKVKDDFDKFGEQIAGGERFLTILERRRLAKKTGEKVKYEWKTTEPDREAVKSKVSGLIGRLKRQFREEKQSRKQLTENTSNYARHIWNNSMGTFLRHHEKPKIEIQYSESSNNSSVEGVYTFAVRPSVIRKRQTREKMHFGTVLQNNVQDTTQWEVLKMQMEVKSHNTTQKLKDDFATPSNKETISVDVNGHEQLLCNKTPMTLDTFYHHTVTMLNKVNAQENVTGQAVQQNFEVTPSCNVQVKNLRYLYSVPRLQKYFGHIQMVTMTYKPAKYDHAIRQHSNSIVQGIFNVYRHLSSPFYDYPSVKLDRHIVPQNYIHKIFACNVTVPS